MTVIGFHGDPCEACLTDRDRARDRGDRLPPVQSASRGSLCVRHWLAASPARRATEDLAMQPEAAPVCPDYPPVWLGGEAA